jgi:hypothetical protein
MNIQKLMDDSHRISKEHGWLEDPRPYDEITALFHSELSEALEDYRSNHSVTEIYYEVKLITTGFHGTKSVGLEELEVLKKADGIAGTPKPCGIPIELADFIIRIAQYCGTNNWDLEKAVNSFSESLDGAVLGPKGFGEILALLHADISLSYLASIKALPDQDELGTHPLTLLASAWFTTFAFCKVNGIDLDKAIAEKQAYNETRSYRHGGKLC